MEAELEAESPPASQPWWLWAGGPHGGPGEKEHAWATGAQALNGAFMQVRRIQYRAGAGVASARCRPGSSLSRWAGDWLAGLSGEGCCPSQATLGLGHLKVQASQWSMEIQAAQQIF